MSVKLPELRKDPVIGRWVIIATERARRPGNFIDLQKNTFSEGACPFCENAAEPADGLRKTRKKAGPVQVIPSPMPIFKTNGTLERSGRGLYNVIKNYGAHEVVVETPQHVANMADLDVRQIQRVMATYRVRFADLETNPQFQYIFAYKNYGWAAGPQEDGAGNVRIAHARSQIIASSVNPIQVKEKLAGAKQYFDYHDRCLYCDLILQEKKHKKRIVMETRHFLAVTPFAPRFPFEICILPKRHHCDFGKGVEGREKDLAKVLKDVLQRIKMGLDDPAYNYVVQTAPINRQRRPDRWHTIEEDYHWHIEVMPRLTRAAGFEKGSGFYICPIPPEDMAHYLRKVDLSCPS